MKRIKLSELDTKLVKSISHGIPFSLYFGADPEFFVANPRGKILNSDQFFPHKSKPKIIDLDSVGIWDSKGKLYFDGIQAEFGFDPVVCRVYFIMSIKNILNEVQRDIGINKIVLKPSVKVYKDILDNAHPEAKIFGCMPDYNAYTLSVNTPPMNAERHPYRYAGGHIHIGLIRTNKISPQYKRQQDILENEEEHLEWIKSLDFFVNLLTLPLDDSPAARRRRSKYGKAGCFRPTPYGIEYRSLSCWWLRSPIFVSLVLGLARLATVYIYHKKAFRKILKLINITEEDIRGAIDESDVKYAKRVWKSVRPILSRVSSTINPLYSKRKPSTPVNSAGIVNLQPITLLDYMLMEGVDGLIDINHPVNEWELKNLQSYRYMWGDKNSFVNGLRQRISNLIGAKRAIKYEKALVKMMG